MITSSEKIPNASPKEPEEISGSMYGAANGVALGCCFAIGVIILVAGIVLYPASDGAPGTARRAIFVGALSCFSALVALAASQFPRLWKMILPPVVLVGFLGVLLGGVLTTGRDLSLISYSKRSHTSLFVEDISATSPSSNERTNYRALYALRRRIAGAHLIIDPSLPLDRWHLKYRADLADVIAADTSSTPSPSIGQVIAWLESGGIELPLQGGKRLVLPPELTTNGTKISTSALAIVAVDTTTYALVQIPQAQP